MSVVVTTTSFVPNYINTFILQKKKKKLNTENFLSLNTSLYFQKKKVIKTLNTSSLKLLSLIEKQFIGNFNFIILKKKKNFFFEILFVKKFILNFLKNGKKKILYKIIFSFISWFKFFYKKSPFLFIVKLLFLFRNTFFIRNYKKSGRIIYKPFLVNFLSQFNNYFNLLKQSILIKNEKFLLDKIIFELLDLYLYKRGFFYKKNLEILQKTVENRSVFHYRNRWW